MFGKGKSSGSSSNSSTSLTHNDKMFVASEEIYRRMHTGECKDSTAELMQAALDVSEDN